MDTRDINILSIDFDFFQLADPQVFVRAYPEAFDLESDLSASVWARQLAAHEKDLDTVRLYSDKLDQLTDILGGQKPDIPLMAAQSHLEAYEFSLRLMESTSAKKVSLFNIDMHHDISNDSKTINCGNWLGRLRQNAIPEMEVTWIASPASRNTGAVEEIDAKLIMDDLSILNDKEFHGIFLCRSDSWLHPKFDGDFTRLLDFLCRHFTNVTILKENGFPKDRYRRARLIADGMGQ